ncbi:hypothetical protein NCC49_003113 [Naganishia albida]|nr:hypothetical protein NCC49_003113 [Naganishia albida]
MPQGLPFVARPPKEGFDAYGRPIPPPAPEGSDGWGRPIPGANVQFPMMQPPGMPHPGMQPRPNMPVQGNTGSRAASPDKPSQSGSDAERPEEPPMFHRAPSTSAENGYADFEPFAFPANRLRQPGTLRRPHALKDHDIRQDEWGFFIEALAHEALRHVDHGNPDHPPRLTKAVHELLRAWQVGYFGPRAVQVYVARDGKKVYEPGFGVPRNRAAPSMRDSRSMYTDTTSYRDVYSDATTTDSSDIDLHEGRFSARQRAYRRERRRQRPRDRRARGGDGGEWEVHFAYTEPTMFKPGLKPRRYGEKVPFERPK